MRFVWQLWFDVEEKGNTTTCLRTCSTQVLWFDVEEKGNTTTKSNGTWLVCCGLM